jgi:hypothetical protein
MTGELLERQLMAWSSITRLKPMNTKGRKILCICIYVFNSQIITKGWVNMKLISKETEVEGFQFKSRDTKPPKWFLDAVKENRAQVTINSTEQSIQIYNKGHTQVEKAFVNDWVIYRKWSDEPGDYKMYKLEDRAVQMDYILHENT